MDARRRYRRRPAAVQKREANINFADRVEEVRILCREMASTLGNVEKWMNAVFNLSAAIRDKGALKELIKTLSTMDLQDKQEELKEVSIDPHNLKTLSAQKNRPKKKSSP